MVKFQHYMLVPNTPSVTDEGLTSVLDFQASSSVSIKTLPYILNKLT